MRCASEREISEGRRTSARTGLDFLQIFQPGAKDPEIPHFRFNGERSPVNPALVSVRGFVFVILGDFREDCPLDPQAVILPATLPVSVLSSERG
jgi:hypothetical protein